MKTCKKLLALLLTLVMVLAMAAPAMADETDGQIAPVSVGGYNFTDISASEWYMDAVRYVCENGLMVGTSETTFGPGTEMSRAQLYQVLYNLEGAPEVEAALSDVEGKWYADAANWAAASGLLAAGEFGEDAAITRGEVAVAFTAYCAGKGRSIEGLFKGDGSSLNLDQPLSRAEMATLLTRLPDLKELGQSAFAHTCVISKYGNVGTTLATAALDALGIEVGDILKVEITGQEPLLLPFGTGYSNVDQGSPLALTDTSNNTLALAINRGDFASAYGLGVKGEDKTYAITEGVSITVSLAEKGGYLAEMEIRDLDSKRTAERDDYASDEVFANFRPIVMGDIAEGVLYRTSSPVNPELGRNAYADNFVKQANVRTVVNLADSRETMEGYEGYADTYYSTLNVIPLNMGVDMYSEDARQSLKAAFEFMIANEGPYAFHCTEGKDRAGYFAMLLEAVMGAGVDEIVEDYMLSFENYYHVEHRSEQWTRIAESNIIKDLLKLTGAETRAELDGLDLAKAAAGYLTGIIGLTAEQVAALRGVLSASAAADGAEAA